MKTVSRGLAAVAAGFLVVGGASSALANPSEDNTNYPSYWENFLESEGYTDVSCVKAEGDYSKYGEYKGSVFVSADAWLLAVVKAGSTGSSVENENTLFWDVQVDAELTHSSGKGISHIIFCDGTAEPTPPDNGDDDEKPGNGDDDEKPEKPEEPGDKDDDTPVTPGDKEPTTPGDKDEDAPVKPVTPGEAGDDAGQPIGPVVQTDVPVKDVNNAAPLTALAAAAGLGLAAVGVRRRNQEG